MHRLNLFTLLQGMVLLISLEEFSLLQNGAKHQVNAIKIKYTCQNDTMSIVCGPKVIKIIKAEYLRKQEVICSRGDKASFNSAETCDPVNKTVMAKGLCDEKVSCTISVNATTMGDHCRTIVPYLNVMYHCVTPPPTTEPQNKSTIVLTKPPSPSPSLDTRPNDRPSNGIEYPESTGSNGDLTDDDYYSSRDVGFILYNAGCIYKTPCFMVVLLTLIVLL